MYSCFVGNIKFVVGGLDLSVDFDWVPLLHFANNMDLIFAAVGPGDEKYYYFTESSDFIRLSAQGDDVLVECSYVPGRSATVNRVDGVLATRAAASTLIGQLEESYPELRGNPIFAEIAERVRRPPGRLD